MSESVQSPVVRRCSLDPPLLRWGRFPQVLLLLLSLTCLALSGCSDIPQLSVEVVGGNALTSESGDSVSLSVSLASRPRGVVTIDAQTTDPTEGSVSGPITFDASNWQSPRVITVTGVDDSEDDGNVAYSVRLLASSSRTPDEEPLEVGVVLFVNSDNEVGSFAGLGDLPGGLIGSYVFDLTPSGDVIVGNSEGPSGRQATRWSGDQISAITNEVSQATGVSPDGRYIAGSIARDTFSGGYWRGRGPFESVYQPNAEPLAPIGFWMSLGVAALDDGQILGNCSQYGNPNPGFDCRFVPPDTLQIVAKMTRIFQADSLGNRVGTLLPSRYDASRFGSLAYFNDQQIPFPAGTCMIPHQCRAEARGLTTGGGVIVGNVSVPGGPNPTPGDLAGQTGFVYTSSEGMLQLPDLAGGALAGAAFAVTEDGAVIGGVGSDAQGTRAVLWIDREPFTVEDILARTGGAAPEGWHLQDVVGFSADGRIVIGNAINPDGNPEAYKIVFPSPLNAPAPSAVALAASAQESASAPRRSW